MQIVQFSPDRDIPRLEDYLADRYIESRSAVSWLPARLHDLIYRVGAQEQDEGREKSADHIRLWEENGEIAACLLPDGENIYVSIRSGWERLFPEMISYAEKNLLSLLPEAEEGSVKIWFAVDSGQDYMQETLKERGYEKYPEEEYLSCIHPGEKELSPELPAGFRLLYGEDYHNEENKWSALRLSFHPDWEAPGYRASMAPYAGRKNSALYRDSFECVVVTDDPAESNDVCAYCFTYVDKRTGTAMVEPVGTREKYTHRGLGTALMHGVVKRCRQLGIEKCYVDNFGWRKDFYAAAGFRVETSCGFWHKRLTV